MASSLEMVLAQRLVRVICTHCKEQTPDGGPRWRCGRNSATQVPEVVYRGTRLPAVPGHRLSRPDGHLRADAGDRGDPGDDPRARLGRHDAQGGGAAGHAEPARRRLAAGARGRTTLEEVVRATKDEQAGMRAVGASSDRQHGIVGAASVAGAGTMAVFTYTALNADGRTTAGSVPAAARAAAHRGDLGTRVCTRSTIARAGRRPSSRPPMPAGRCSAAARLTRHMSRASPANWPTCWPAACRWRGRCICCCREAAAPGPRSSGNEIHDDVVGGTSLADALAQHPECLLEHLRRHGPRRRGGRLPRRGAGADRRLPHPRAGPQGQGQGGDGLPLRAGGAGDRRADLPADVLHPAFSGIFAEFGAALPR